MPNRKPELRADWLVPLVQSLTSGVILGAALAAFVSAGGQVSFWAAYKWTFLLALAGGWLWHLSAAQRTIWTVERMTRRDIDGDGMIGAPAPSRPAEAEPGHLLALNPYMGQQAQRADSAERQREQFIAFVLGCALGSTGARQWEAKIGRARYNQWRDVLISSGFAKWNGSGRKDGWQLTTDADTILASLEDGSGQPLALPGRSSSR